MKKNFFYHLLILPLLLNSCSTSEDGCNEAIEPVGNEFTYNCERYSSTVGRFYISSPNNKPTTLCLIQLINSPYENFHLTEDDININQISIRIAIPAECYVSREIPTGIYHYYATDDNNYEAFDILSTQVAYNSGMYDGGWRFKQSIQGTDFTDTTVNISKSGNIFTIIYNFVTTENKIIKGQFIGEMPVVNNPN